MHAHLGLFSSPETGGGHAEAACKLQDSRAKIKNGSRVLCQGVLMKIVGPKSRMEVGFYVRGFYVGLYYSAADGLMPEIWAT